MANASIHSEPAGPGEIGSPVSRRSLVARRRRILVLVVLAAVVAIGIAANYGPLQSYLESRSRLDKATAKVAALEAQKLELQARLGKLTEAQYLEMLARGELTYARTGEDVYIVTGIPEDRVEAEPGTGNEASISQSPDGDDESVTLDTESVMGGSEGAADGPGPLERLLSRFLDLF